MNSRIHIITYIAVGLCLIAGAALAADGWQVYAGGGVIGQSTIMYENWNRSGVIGDVHLTLHYSGFSLRGGVRAIPYEYPDTVSMAGTDYERTLEKSAFYPNLNLKYDLYNNQNEKESGYDRISLGLHSCFGSMISCNFTEIDPVNIFEVDTTYNQIFNFFEIGPTLSCAWNIPRTTLHLYGETGLFFVSYGEENSLQTAMSAGITTYFLLWDGRPVWKMFSPRRD